MSDEIATFINIPIMLPKDIYDKINALSGGSESARNNLITEICEDYIKKSDWFEEESCSEKKAKASK